MPASWEVVVMAFLRAEQIAPASWLANALHTPQIPVHLRKLTTT
jgi:hypothetical protein